MLLKIKFQFVSGTDNGELIEVLKFFLLQHKDHRCKNSFTESNQSFTDIRFPAQHVDSLLRFLWCRAVGSKLIPKTKQSERTMKYIFYKV